MATLAERVNSRGYTYMQDLVEQPKKHHYDGPICYMPKAIEILEQSPLLVGPQMLVQLASYANPSSKYVSISSFIVCLTYYDNRVFESDSGKIGLLGVHDDV